MTFFRKQVSLLNCSRQCIARSFTQKLHLGKGSGYVVNHYHQSILCDAYAIRGIALRMVPRIVLDIYMYICIYICIYYIYPPMRGISISIVFIRLGLASLAQLSLLLYFLEFGMEITLFFLNPNTLSFYSFHLAMFISM